MPYILKEERKKFEEPIKNLIQVLNGYVGGQVSAGELNYVLSKILWTIFQNNRSYALGNMITGALSDVKNEFYQRPFAEYEAEKRKQNGDLEL